jgi:hypothetical protein
MSSAIVHKKFPATPLHCFEIHVGAQTAKAAHTHDIHAISPARRRARPEGTRSKIQPNTIDKDCVGCITSSQTMGIG